MGLDGWWPDEGDPLDIASRLVRNRMYWDGPQLDRPNERPYALHRNGYAGMQRYASFLWSGDVYSTWKTLKTQISIGINTGLTGIPYWGTDIGGFVPTPEFTAELYLRWFQFGAFCTLFRSHGRTWKLRLPWGWNTGDPGPIEIRNYDGAAIPDAASCIIPKSSAFAENIWNSVIGCCLISTARSASAPSLVCPSCAPCGCTSLTIPRQWLVMTNTCGEEIS